MKVAKAERNKKDEIRRKAKSSIMNNQQPSLKRKVQRLSFKRVGRKPEVAAPIIMGEDIVQNLFRK